MANSIIEQKPLYPQMPVGQEVIFVVSNADAVANQTKVKFCVDVHISGNTPPNPNVVADKVATFKAAPNNAGVGIFDMRNVIENYVKADNMAADGSTYKGTTTSDNDRHPLHLVDKFSLNNNTVKYMALEFYVEYLGATDQAGNQDNNVVRQAAGTEVLSEIFTIFNGYLKYDDVLTLGSGVTAADFGYSLNSFNLSSTSSKFLTNAPVSQYANLEDYGTVSFLAPNDNLEEIRFTYKSSAGASIGTDTVTKANTTGAYLVWSEVATRQLLHFGCFPGNLQNWSATFQGLVAAETINGGSIEISAYDSGGNRISKAYTININCPNLKGYESIRLCWLNQWGVWDYYTFTKKSVKSISTSGTTYNQLGGTWNESRYRLDSYKGGKKSFRVNATERILMNTDFVTEDDNVMFEELINSPEVYLLDGYQTESFSALNQYVTPVRLTTSSFTRKTIGNDKLLQYTFEIEKSKTLRTQSV